MFFYPIGALSALLLRLSLGPSARNFGHYFSLNLKFSCPRLMLSKSANRGVAAPYWPENNGPALKPGFHPEVNLSAGQRYAYFLVKPTAKKRWGAGFTYLTHDPFFCKSGERYA